MVLRPTFMSLVPGGCVSLTWISPGVLERSNSGRWMLLPYGDRRTVAKTSSCGQSVKMMQEDQKTLDK